MTQHSRRSGSALVIVLGMTAVLMMMAIAFSVLMRTERSGMTNLKHALTARQTTHTAIARVMSAIDQSFKDPTNSWPIAGWDPPYLSSFSSSTQDWQNASIRRTEDRKNNARLLTDELSRHLSPSQLALAKSAKIDWVTIRAGVGASEATTQGGPKNDMIVARYAFLAFNTAGLLDMNTAPMTNGTDAVKQQALAGTDFVKFLGREGDANLIAQRTKLGEFTSYAEMWRSLLGDKRYPYRRNEVITPDLLNTFSMSLDEVDPDGKMKLFIPKGTAGKTFKNDTEKKTYAKLALERFERIFKDEKKFTNNMDVDLSWTPLPKLTRAQLATQALIDYIDDDRKPNGGIWSDGAVDPLNYPCTENVPMINQAYAQFEVTESPTVMKPAETAGDPTTWYKIYNVRLNVLCRAQYFGTDAMPPGYTLAGDFELTGFADFFEKVGFLKTDERKMYIDNNRFFNDLSRAEKDAFTAKMQLTPASNDGNLLAANGIKDFQVRVYPASTITQPEPAVLGWHKFTLPEENNDPKPLALEVRVSAKVKSATDGVVHQVPAPALYPARDEYRIRVDPGIHPKRTGGGGEPYAEGWALSVDPRFAYNTRAIGTYPGEGYIAWVTSEMCSPDGGIRSENRMAFRPMWEVADMLTELEKNGNIMSGADEHNRLIERVIFRNFGTEKLSPRNTSLLMNAFAKDQKIYPDVFHSEKLGGQMFIDNGEDRTKALQFIVADKPMTSIGEFGNLLIGPWETLSLFATFAPGTDALKVDFHRVSDYFSLAEARFPKVADIPAAGLTGITDEYLPAIHAGKLNLNPQLKVICDDDIAESGKLSNLFNADPLAVVLASAPIDEDETARIPFSTAKIEAENFYADVAISGQHRDDPIDMFRFTSDIGNVNVASNANPVLTAVVATRKAKTDADRERFLGTVLDRITTRGQTYLVLVRADAYSPKYGSEGAQGGTTLATEYALLELWRDSEPNRFPDGTYYPDKNYNPKTPKSTAPVHSWFIRSCRFFSP